MQITHTHTKNNNNSNISENVFSVVFAVYSGLSASPPPPPLKKSDFMLSISLIVFYIIFYFQDGAIFHHWRRVADEGKDYPFARFNKVSDKRGEIIVLVFLLGLVEFKFSSTNV